MVLFGGLLFRGLTARGARAGPGPGLALKKVTTKGCLERGACRPSRPARPGSTLRPEMERAERGHSGAGAARGQAGTSLRAGWELQAETPGAPTGPGFPPLKTRVPSPAPDPQPPCPLSPSPCRGGAATGSGSGLASSGSGLVMTEGVSGANSALQTSVSSVRLSASLHGDPGRIISPRNRAAQ